ncbi:hypothetical protein BaRGS_00022563 [Batillaria attramentaria]|uniref:Uncharacterized protein n=1 Tax=Batillaria attramentaria TaxID=370345 RepID=A0ABD0KGD9_9CAEN
MYTDADTWGVVSELRKAVLSPPGQFDADTWGVIIQSAAPVSLSHFTVIKQQSGLPVIPSSKQQSGLPVIPSSKQQSGLPVIPSSAAHEHSDNVNLGLSVPAA